MTDSGQGRFGLLLREKRYEAGLTQAELAEHAAVSSRTIGDLERGARQPHQRTAVLLADAMGLTGPGRDELIRAARPAARQPSPGPGPDGNQQAPIPAVPRQLPAPTADFTGRAAELGTLARLLERDDGWLATVVVSAIGGTAGVGKPNLEN